MDFTNASHGISFTGMQNYKNDLQMGTFLKIREAIRNTSEVVNAVRAGWEGTAADNFIANINKGSDMMAEKMSEIEEMLMRELDGIMSQIGDMDANLVERE